MVNREAIRRMARLLARFGLVGKREAHRVAPLNGTLYAPPPAATR